MPGAKVLFAVAAMMAAIGAGLSPAGAEAEDQPLVAATPPPAVSPAEVARFAEAYGRIQDIRRRHAVDMAGREADERRALRDRANAEMRTALEDSGLARDRYNELVAALAADPAFRQHVDGLIAERHTEREP